MSMKLESKSSHDDDVESGQCSDDEVQIIKKEKKSKRHKKKDKIHKTRKRRHSSSSSSVKSSSEFFNPYSVNPSNKLSFKTECFEMEDNPCGHDEITNGGAFTDLMNNTFDNICSLTCDLSKDKLSMECNDALELNGQIESICDSDKEFHEQQMNKRREFEYFNDISGIDTVTSDLHHYLLDLGLSSGLVTDLMKVFDKGEEKLSENFSEHDDDDSYEEEMINDIHIIDQSKHSDDALYTGSYSPERVNIVEPYKPQNQISVAYAPTYQNSNDSQHLNQIIDPLSIPQVGPRDPRLNQSKTLLQMKSNPNLKNADINNDKSYQNADIDSVVTKEWEAIVVDVVKAHLGLYLEHNDINKEEYKSILKRAVTKILTSGEKKLETDKIAKFLHSYVTMIQKSRI